MSKNFEVDVSSAAPVRGHRQAQVPRLDFSTIATAQGMFDELRRKYQNFLENLEQAGITSMTSAERTNMFFDSNAKRWSEHHPGFSPQHGTASYQLIKETLHRITAIDPLPLWQITNLFKLVENHYPTSFSKANVLVICKIELTTLLAQTELSEELNSAIQDIFAQQVELSYQQASTTAVLPDNLDASRGPSSLPGPRYQEMDPTRERVLSQALTQARIPTPQIVNQRYTTLDELINAWNVPYDAFRRELQRAIPREQLDINDIETVQLFTKVQRYGKNDVARPYDLILQTIDNYQPEIRQILEDLVKKEKWQLPLEDLLSVCHFILHDQLFRTKRFNQLALHPHLLQEILYIFMQKINNRG